MAEPRALRVHHGRVRASLAPVDFPCFCPIFNERAFSLLPGARRELIGPLYAPLRKIFPRGEVRIKKKKKKKEKRKTERSDGSLSSTGAPSPAEALTRTAERSASASSGKTGRLEFRRRRLGPPPPIWHCAREGTARAHRRAALSRPPSVKTSERRRASKHLVKSPVNADV